MENIFRCSACPGYVDAFSPEPGCDQYGCDADHLLCAKCATSGARECPCKRCGGEIINITSLCPDSAARSAAFHLRRSIRGCTKCKKYFTSNATDAVLHSLLACPGAAATAAAAGAATKTSTGALVALDTTVTAGGVEFDAKTGTLAYVGAGTPTSSEGDDSGDLFSPVAVYVSCRSGDDDGDWFLGRGVLSCIGDKLVFPPSAFGAYEFLLQSRLSAEEPQKPYQITLSATPVFEDYPLDPETWTATWAAPGVQDGTCKNSVARWREDWNAGMTGEIMAAHASGNGNGGIPATHGSQPRTRRPVWQAAAFPLIAERYTSKELAAECAVFEMQGTAVGGINGFLFGVADTEPCASIFIICPGCLGAFGSLHEFAEHIDLHPKLIMQHARNVGAGLCEDFRLTLQYALQPRFERLRRNRFPKSVAIGVDDRVVFYGAVINGILRFVRLWMMVDQTIALCPICDDQEIYPTVKDIAAHMGTQQDIVANNFYRIRFVSAESYIFDTLGQTLGTRLRQADEF